MDQSKIDRRGFIGTMGAVATGLALANQATAQVQDTKAGLSASGSNPDVLTRALPRTVQAMTCPLPDDRMRVRMVAHMETIPGFGTIGSMPWYPGNEMIYSGLIREAQANAARRLR